MFCEARCTDTSPHRGATKTAAGYDCRRRILDFARTFRQDSDKRQSQGRGRGVIFHSSSAELPRISHFDTKPKVGSQVGFSAGTKTKKIFKKRCIESAQKEESTAATEEKMVHQLARLDGRIGQWQFVVVVIFNA
jgi:hypothetical protein